MTMVTNHLVIIVNGNAIDHFGHGTNGTLAYYFAPDIDSEFVLASGNIATEDND